ncbi:hypothetical protein [Aestuariicoccus sp. MJ-SS9]|uniref:hypothetical protein n=1 Tax=Aestuariicoccus sp. MJ-SS9 TaxID=3079855 RepID=UPI00290A2E27|nr:hypothetical protein [Aestuariicoccus sp. MJ-SS9]MDU8913518.1 hypothetical protein [Aestuariicoccus sp. MJ-SS9]
MCNTVETSHAFCKGFFEPSVAAGFRPSLLLLTRDTRTTALSHRRKNAVPRRTDAGFAHLIAPSDDVYLPVADPASLSDYQLCYWYCLEIQLRQTLYTRIAEKLDMKVVRMETSELSDMDRLVEVVTPLGLADATSARAALARAGVEKAHNATPKAKQTAPDFDLETEGAALLARLGPPATVADVQVRIDRARSFL